MGLGPSPSLYRFLRVTAPSTAVKPERVFGTTSNDASLRSYIVHRPWLCLKSPGSTIAGKGVVVQGLELLFRLVRKHVILLRNPLTISVAEIRIPLQALIIRRISQVPITL